MLTAEEARVVGALAEKQLTTPQYYPLTLNALVNACNQSNNRDPVVSYSEDLVQETIAALRQQGYARVVHPGSGSRATKYRQVLDEALGLDRRELALLCVLLLRGPQTLSELKVRTERMADFDGIDDVQHDLDRLAEREPPLVVNVGRRAGQREERFATTLAPVAAAEPTPSVSGDAVSDDAAPDDAVPDDALSAALARHPDLLRRWRPFTIQLLERGHLAPRLRDLAVLRTAYLTRDAYDWRIHAARAVERTDLSDEDVERIGSADGDAWTGADAAVIDACDEIHRDGVIASHTSERLAEVLDERALIELPLLVGHQRMLATVTALLGVQPESGLPPIPG